MSLIEFTVNPWADLEVRRTIQISGTSSLAELHSAIVEAFGYEDEQSHAFFLNGHAWDDEFGIWSHPKRGRRHTRATKLETLGLLPNKRFLHIFDFVAELRFDVRVRRISEAEEGPAQGRVIESVGEAPPQYEDFEEKEDSEERDSEVLDVEGVDAEGVDAEGVDAEGVDAEGVDAEEPDGECEGHVPNPELADLAERLEPIVGRWSEQREDEELDQESPEATESREHLVKEHELALELLDRTHDDFDAIHVDIEHAIEDDALGWLLDLPARLATVGLSELAARLSQRLLAMQDGSWMRAALPLYLAEAGLVDEARTTIEKNLEQEPEDPEFLFNAGLAWGELGEADRAEQCLREALSFAGTNLDLRNAILECLLDSLGSNQAAVDQVMLAEKDRLKRWSVLSGSFAGDLRPVRREGPKVGRNDPCPCGSGKKFKKCCGGINAG